MALERFVRFVFVVYCTTVGMMLVMVPWSPMWSLILDHLPFEGLRFLASPLARGAVTGFGLVHLVWSIHDLDIFLRASLPQIDSPLDATTDSPTEGR